jgi:hypothetical protein
MGKRTHRWSPPQPDRTKHPEPRDPRVVFGDPEMLMCIWPECVREATPWLRFRMCEAHGREVADMVTRWDDPPGVMATIEKNDQTRAENTRKINAGERVDTTTRHLVPGWIYYALIDGLIKIGFAKDVPSRMRQYPPTAQLLAVEPGTLQVERTRHQHFGQHLAKGREWFADVPELREWISTVVTEYGSAAQHAHTWGREAKRPTVAGKRQRRGYAI